MYDENSERFSDKLSEDPTKLLSVERVDPSELNIVAKVLAAAYAEDPIHIWAMPRAATRLADATMFFTFYFRRMRQYGWDVFATIDRSAVSVACLVRKGNGVYRGEVRNLPTLVRKLSSVNDYFQWIEAFRPNADHYYIEFIGCLPAQRSQGRGSVLLGNILEIADRDGLPVWSWSSNPRNLMFYQRHGFQTEGKLQRDGGTPAVTWLWRPPR